MYKSHIGFYEKENLEILGSEEIIAKTCKTKSRTL